MLLVRLRGRSEGRLAQILRSFDVKFRESQEFLAGASMN
jgi:hypothetical protein